MKIENVLFIIILLLCMGMVYVLSKPTITVIPKIIKGKDSIVWVIDTVRDTFTVWRDKRHIIDTQYVLKHDTTITDSNRCWEFDETEPDGAEINVKLCSKNLPVLPIDIRYMIGYIKSPIDSIKTIIRIDTREIVMENKKKQFVVGLFSIVTGISIGFAASYLVNK